MVVLFTIWNNSCVCVSPFNGPELLGVAYLSVEPRSYNLVSFPGHDRQGMDVDRNRWCNDVNIR